MNVEAKFKRKLGSKSQFVPSDLISDIATDRDTDAFQRIYNHFASQVKGYFTAQGLTQDVAETLTHDVMLSIWFQAATYDPHKLDVRTWIFKITRNRWILHHRGDSRVEPELDDQMSV